MANTTLETRVAVLESQVARLFEEKKGETLATPWWERIVGTFENDPDYVEAMRLGRTRISADPTGIGRADSVHYKKSGRG